MLHKTCFKLLTLLRTRAVLTFVTLIDTNPHANSRQTHVCPLMTLHIYVVYRLHNQQGQIFKLILLFLSTFKVSKTSIYIFATVE